MDINKKQAIPMDRPKILISEYNFCLVKFLTAILK
jgi:hypothetical protein